MELKLTALEAIHLPDLIAHRFGPLQGDHIGIIGIDRIAQAQAQAEVSFLIEGQVLDKAQLQTIGEVSLAQLLRPIQQQVVAQTNVKLVLEVFAIGY